MAGAVENHAPRHILFGHYPSWTAEIAQRLDHARFMPSFAPFDRVDPTAFDAIIPVRLEHFAPLRALTPEKALAFLPTVDAVDLCVDKLALRNRLKELGFADSLPPDVVGPQDYPCVLKPRTGEFGSGIRILDQPEPIPDDHYLERLIPGEREYTFHLLRAGGRTFYYQAIRYEMAEANLIRSDDCRPKKAQLVDGAPLLDWAERILDAIGFEGLCCMNFKLVERQPRLFEINPRFGGSLVFDITRFTAAYCDALDAINQD